MSRKALTIIAVAWVSAWVALQYLVLFSSLASDLSQTTTRQPWWSQLGDIQAGIVPLLVFLLTVALLHGLLAWANADAFQRLLAPRINSTRTQRITFLTQLCLVTLALSLLNAWAYPQSAFGDLFVLMVLRSHVRLFVLAMAGLGSIYFGMWAFLVLRQCLRARPKTTAVASSALALTIALHVSLGHAAAARSAPSAAPKAPNVIVIGVDSLRPDHVGKSDLSHSVTPHLDALLAGSATFPDTLTAQPHTFPSTVSILTGLYPVHSGARGNLFPPAQVRTQASMAWQFKSQGYRTVFATDETRFSNIDEQYGFDEIVGPGIGVSDYLMSFVSDTSVVNLLANTPVGRWLFPHLYGNRAVAHVYQPQSFSKKLGSAITRQDNRPLFLYVHFCAGHWPYSAASPYAEDGLASYRQGRLAYTNTSYLRAIAHADQQVGALLDDLQARHDLGNAIVVTLSDHGEDFDMAKDRLVGPEGLLLQGSTHGHGGSASRGAQTQVVLGFKRFGTAPYNIASIPMQASLIDVAPTLYDLAGLHARTRQPADGISLAPWINGDLDDTAESRIRFVESSYFPKALNTASIDEGKVLEEVANKYEFTPEGRVQIRTEFIPEQVEERERAAYKDDLLLLWDTPPSQRAYLIDRKSGSWQPFDGTSTHAAANDLADAMCLHWRDDEVSRLHCPSKPN